MENLEINLVYESHDFFDNKPNCSNYYPNRKFWDVEDFIKSYVNTGTATHFIKVVKHNIDDIDKLNDIKLYYIIGNSDIDLKDIISDEIILNSKIIDILKNKKNFNLVFLSHHEPDSESGFFILDKFLKENNINHNQIWLINNNDKLNDYKLKFKSKINVYSINYLPKSVCSAFLSLGTCEIIENKDKLFMCFNKSPKIHRLCCLIYLKKHNLLNATNWSFIPPADQKNKYTLDFYNELLDGNYSKEIYYFENLKIKKSDFEKDILVFDEQNRYLNIDSQKKLAHNPEYADNYKSSYINIVTESSFLDFSNNIHISEKSFKPFFYYQIPIFLSTHNHVKSLKKRYNFDMFDDIINHSYDNEPNQKNRFNLVMNEIKRLHNNGEQIREFYKKNIHRFINNHQIIKEISASTSDYEFFKSLL